VALLYPVSWDVKWIVGRVCFGYKNSIYATAVFVILYCLTFIIIIIIYLVESRRHAIVVAKDTQETQG